MLERLVRVCVIQTGQEMFIAAFFAWLFNADNDKVTML